MKVDECGIRTRKAAERTRLRQFREGLRADEHARRSDLIAGHIRSLPEVRAAQCVHVFWPMVSRQEVDTRTLIAWLYTHKKQIVLPVVVRSEAEAGREHLEHRLFTGEDALVRSRWGVLEPAGSDAVPPGQIDVVIVPALGADRSGNRLGYGRGHYDQFLRQLRVPTVCPVFQECVQEALPVEPHDVPIGVIVTENEIWRVPQS